jgi:hypothetical protein
MKKKTIIQIREIASKLPVVYEQHMSGFEWVEEVKGEDPKPQPNLYLIEINHERRLRHAYEKLGMAGIHSYLEQIHKLQTERNEKAKRDADAVLPGQDSVPQVADTIVSDSE